ncbi:MAG: excisionase family DNA-binding protein [Bacteroidetes bacterium]|nr:excisionase family DNA-binding protein [Bacteroidota bacterium]
MWQLNEDKSKDKKIQELETRLEQVEKKLNHLVTVVREPGKNERYIDLLGACRFLDCGKTLIYDLMKSGELAFTQVGRHRRILLSDLRNYASKNYKKAKPSILKP